MKTINSKAAAGGAAFFASAALAVALVPGSAQATDSDIARHSGGTATHADLDPLNNSGARGHAMVRTQHQRLSVHVHARGVTKGMPHAQHIHYGETARNECPSAPKDDTNGDFRLNVVEGVPAYGPIAVSLTKRGDTSPASALDVDRFPTAPEGKFNYERHTRTSKAVARAIRMGEAVVVVHGVDYNGNGKYDFGSAGKSELDPTLPAEATDPALCGVLRR